MAISKPSDMDYKPNAAGRPVWCVDLRIVDDGDRPVKVGEIGEIICQSPLATEGYYKNPEATNASFETAGSIPAIWATSTKKAISLSQAGRRTWSRAAVSASILWKSKA